MAANFCWLLNCSDCILEKCHTDFIDDVFFIERVLNGVYLNCVFS